MRRLLLLMVALAAVSTSRIPRSMAQDVNVAAVPEPSEYETTNLVFSNDGRTLREVIQFLGPATDKYWHVRAISYDAATGRIRHVLSLRHNTSFLSATADGRIAVITADRGEPGKRSHCFLLDTNSGRAKDIPSKWFETDVYDPYAQISGDGRLVSSYSEVTDIGMVVTVYEWRTRKVVGKQARRFDAGGILWGGVTEDGKIAFSNNRVGSEIVDPKTGGLIAQIGPDSVRSSDGAWIAEFPNQLDDNAPKYVPIENGMDGKVVGKLDLQMTDDEQSKPWRGAFCGTSGRFVAANPAAVLAYETPSGKQIARFPIATWQDSNANGSYLTVVACSSNGKRVAIRSGTRLTLHDLK